MKKITLLCLYLFASNASAMSDYEFCKMLDDSGDPNGTVEYVSESYFEGKNVKDRAQSRLKSAIGNAVINDKMSKFVGNNSGSFISQCLKELKDMKEHLFESD